MSRRQKHRRGRDKQQWCDAWGNAGHGIDSKRLRTLMGLSNLRIQIMQRTDAEDWRTASCWPIGLDWIVLAKVPLHEVVPCVWLKILRNRDKET